MKCPLLAIAWGPAAATSEVKYPDCLEEICAWWCAYHKICWIAQLGFTLNVIADELSGRRRKV